MMNSRGLITVDYLFTFFLVCGFCLVILTFSATLSVVEVVQYMTFSAARNYFAGNVTEAKQKEKARNKFMSMKSDPAIAPLLSGGWFNVPNDSLVVDYNIPAKYPAFSDYNPNPQHNLFDGAIVQLDAQILSFQIPFFGTTVQQNNGSSTSSQFSTYITSFLGREPSYDECKNFNTQRWKAIKNLPNQMGASGYSAAQGDSDYVVINDNGC